MTDPTIYLAIVGNQPGGGGSRSYSRYLISIGATPLFASPRQNPLPVKLASSTILILPNALVAPKTRARLEKRQKSGPSYTSKKYVEFDQLSPATYTY